VLVVVGTWSHVVFHVHLATDVLIVCGLRIDCRTVRVRQANKKNSRLSGFLQKRENGYQGYCEFCAGIIGLAESGDFQIFSIVSL
jgi:hypothetical protein